MSLFFSQLEVFFRYTHYSVQLSLPCIKIPSDVTLHDNLERTDQNNSLVQFINYMINDYFYQLLIHISKHISKRISTHSIETILSNWLILPITLSTSSQSHRIRKLDLYPLRNRTKQIQQYISLLHISLKVYKLQFKTSKTESSPIFNTYLSV